MKRYNMRDVTPYVTVHPDGEWVRYEDHIEAMKRLAQQPQGAFGTGEITEEAWRDYSTQAAPVAQGLTDPQIRGHFILAGGWQDDDTADWEISDKGLREAVRAILAQAVPSASAPKDAP